MKNSIFGIIIMVMLSFLLVDCQKKKEDNTARNAALALALMPKDGGSVYQECSASEKCVDMKADLALVSTPSQAISTSSVSVKDTIVERATGDQTVISDLVAKDVLTGKVRYFQWSITINESSFSAKGNTTKALPPGTYDFTLSIPVSTSKQYVGKASGVVIGDGVTTSIPFTITPIIGGTEVITNLVNMSYFAFKYRAEELANFTEPKMGIVIDNGSETVYKLSGSNAFTVTTQNSTTAAGATTPQTNAQYVNYFKITPGKHNIKMNFYDGNLQKGKAELIDYEVVAGQNIETNIKPLNGDAVINFTTAGGDASFTFNIPKEIVDEAGGLSNLGVKYSAVGASSGTKTGELSSISIDPKNSSNYKATITLSSMQPETISLTLTYYKKSEPSKSIGLCTMANISLDADPTTSNTASCVITLEKKAVIEGSLLGVLGMNVYDSGNLPSKGSTVSIINTDGSESLLGVAGSGPTGTTDGYLKNYLKQGTYKLKAYSPDKVKCSITQDVTITALSVNNADFKLTENCFTSVSVTQSVQGGNGYWSSALRKAKLYFSVPSGTTKATITKLRAAGDLDGWESPSQLEYADVYANSTCTGTTLGAKIVTGRQDQVPTEIPSYANKLIATGLTTGTNNLVLCFDVASGVHQLWSNYAYWFEVTVKFE